MGIIIGECLQLCVKCLKTVNLPKLIFDNLEKYIKAIAVTEKENNPDSIFGIPVFCITYCPSEYRSPKKTNIISSKHRYFRMFYYSPKRTVI